VKLVLNVVIVVELAPTFSVWMARRDLIKSDHLLIAVEVLFYALKRVVKRLTLSFLVELTGYVPGVPLARHELQSYVKGPPLQRQ